jgi:CubicO group peptidase (beta-lactamase class C family)
MRIQPAFRAAACAAILALPTLSQTGVEVPELAGFESAVNTVMNTHKIPGAAVAVVYQGRLVYARGIGLADRDRPTERVQPDSIFRVASLSKLIFRHDPLRLRPSSAGVEAGSL